MRVLNKGIPALLGISVMLPEIRQIEWNLLGGGEGIIEETPSSFLVYILTI